MVNVIQRSQKSQNFNIGGFRELNFEAFGHVEFNVLFAAINCHTISFLGIETMHVRIHVFTSFVVERRTKYLSNTR